MNEQQIQIHSLIKAKMKQIRLLDEFDLVDAVAARHDPTYDPDGDFLWQNFERKQNLNDEIRQLESRLANLQEN